MKNKMMIRIILTSNSNKQIDNVLNDIINAIKVTGAIKVGPVCFKGKKLIDIYNYNSKTIDMLMEVKRNDRVELKALSK